jgi:tetratricopeptide (TPR) repeat protein
MEDYAAAKSEDPNFKLSDDELNTWAEQLMDEAHLPEAISLLTLNTQLHPDSSQAYLDLGDAHERSGEERLAIENYKKSITLDPLRSALPKLRKIQAQLAGN